MSCHLKQDRRLSTKSKGKKKYTPALGMETHSVSLCGGGRIGSSHSIYNSVKTQRDSYYFCGRGLVSHLHVARDLVVVA